MCVFVCVCACVHTSAQVLSVCSPEELAGHLAALPPRGITLVKTAWPSGVYSFLGGEWNPETHSCWASTLPLSHTPAPLGLSFQGEQRKSMWRELPGASTKPPPRLEVTSSSWTRPRRAIWLTELMLESLGGGGGQRSLASVMCWGKKRSHCIQHRYGACQRSEANLIGDFSL
jgi:hypothetical protein